MHCLIVTLITFSTFLSSAIAIPTRGKHHVARTEFCDIQPPLSNGSMSLPAPTTPLKALTLGLGTQNYTCPSSTNSTALPTLIGAKATLFNLSPFLPWIEPYLSTLPIHALALSESRIAQVLGVLGSHIFNAAGSPTFDLGEMGELVAKKAEGGDIVAPVQEDGKKTINWLKLQDKGGSQGVGGAYRVDTVGGTVGDACVGKGEGEEVNREYAALYYFYE